MSDLELPVSLFTCPICHSLLQPARDTWRCDGSLHPKQTSHPFDVARQGYVNLLPVQQKKSKAPGDSQQSIDARKRFLDAGYYQPLQTLICQQMTQLLAENRAAIEEDAQPIRWLDIGCGEGYYTQAMAQTGLDTLIAADISKPALASLAKVSKAANYLWYQQSTDTKQIDTKQIDTKQTDTKKAAIYPVVTSAAHLPLRPYSMTGISSIFSPILPEAFAAVLQDEGYLLIAKPDAGHLASMREALFDSVREHDSDKFLPALAPYFELIDTHNISVSLSLPVEALTDLLTMTPYAYRAHTESRRILLASAETKPFITEAKFVVYALKKRTTLS